MEDEQPTIIDRYALFGAIARGGMASVHLGRLVGSAGFARTVAIKRLHPQYADNADFVSMFVDEARLAARIRHPNVVPTLDVVHTDEALFIVMEFVQGESLSQLCRTLHQRGQAVPPRCALPIMSGALHGLHAAHTATNEHGRELHIVHRDVSPQNILVGTDGVPRVFDFGIAKARGRLHTTEEGQIKGKLAYMSPEQLSGEEVGPYTDVFAAGVVLWELLAGRRMYDAKYEAELFGLVMKGCSTPPSAYQPGIAPELDEIVMKAIAQDPDDRYRSARQMASELEALGEFALPSELGQWVERLASFSLHQRSQIVADIESKDDLLAEMATISREVPIGAVLKTSASSETAEEPTQAKKAEPVTASEDSATRPLIAAPPERRRWLIAGLAMLLAFGLALGIGLFLRSGERELVGGATASTKAPEAAESVPVAEVPTASAEPSTAAFASALPEPTATATPTTTASVAVSPPPANTGKPPTTAATGFKPPSTAPSPGSPAGCDPPHYYDSDGIKHLKPQCL